MCFRGPNGDDPIGGGGGRGNLTPRDALLYLERKARGYIGRGERAAAEQLLNEAQGIIERINDPSLFHWTLRMAGHNYRIGRKAEADTLFSLVLSYVDSEKHQYKRDEIRFAAVMTYLEIGNMENSIGTARKIEDPVTKFTAFRETAKKYIDDGNNEQAAKFILSDGIGVARSQPSRSAKVEHLIIFADLLLSINEREKALDLLNEAAGHLSNLETSDDRHLEMVAIRLAQMGKRESTIELITKGWVNEDHPGLTPEAIKRYKQEVIKDRFPKAYPIIFPE